jgi:hypothetical protein
MDYLTVSQLGRAFHQLRAQYHGGQISPQQFVEQVQRLQARDEAGNWWAIDPQTGEYLRYTGTQWVPAAPPGGPGGVPRSPEPVRAPQARSGGGGCRGCLASPIMVGLLSFGTAAVWFAYTSLSPSSEGMDLTTPLAIGGVPFALRLFQKPIDRLLSPLYALLSKFPRPLLTGAAFALPLVFGYLFTGSGGAGYGALRNSTIVSVLAGYVLTRRTVAR